MADEVVSVALWRGYVTGCFYARPADRDVAVAQSPSFRIARFPWEERIELDRDPAVAAALEALQGALIDAGWQQISAGAGPRWYELSFRARKVESSRLRVAEPVGDAPAETPERAEPPVAEPPQRSAESAVAREIVAALRAGPLSSSELSRRIERSSGAVRVARRELELAGLVRKAAPPAGRSRRAIYWQLTWGESRENGRRRERERVLHEVGGRPR